jgi:RNA polymerase sigma-70 factor (ECF subfamily)
MRFTTTRDDLRTRAYPLHPRRVIRASSQTGAGWRTCVWFAMRSLSTATDEELLVANTSAAFGEFYDRHSRALLGYFARRTRDPEVAADLTAETFASAIVSQRRYQPERSTAVAWLFVIASRRLADYQRRGWVDQRVRRALAIERKPLAVDDTEMIRLLAEDSSASLLESLPADQREAIAGHVVDDRGYSELAEEMRVTEAVVRQRVSRGLSVLRRRMGAKP